MVLHVLAGPDSEEALVDLVFAETGTLGIRRIGMSRSTWRSAAHVTVDGRRARRWR